MGSLLGPTFVNFMCHTLSIILSIINSENSPNFYCRYVDDICSAFIDNDKSSEVFNHINASSIPLKFTIEEMNENQLNFFAKSAK